MTAQQAKELAELLAAEDKAREALLFASKDARTRMVDDRQWQENITKRGDEYIRAWRKAGVARDTLAADQAEHALVQKVLDGNPDVAAS